MVSVAGIARRWVLASLLCLFASGTGPSIAQTPETFDLILKGGRVIDPESRLDAVRDIGIRDGKVAAISSEALHGRRVIDARGLVVAPGFIDLHSHAYQLPGARMQAFDGVTSSFELEAGVLPVSRYYDSAAKEGRPINYGASVSWAAARYAIFNSMSADDVPVHLNEWFKKDRDGWVNTIATPQQQQKLLPVARLRPMPDGGRWTARLSKAMCGQCPGKPRRIRAAPALSAAFCASTCARAGS
jgi:predicted amidohydrolase YtcJ